MIAYQDAAIWKLSVLLERDVEDAQQTTTALPKPSAALGPGRGLVPRSAGKRCLIESEGDSGACQLPAEPTRPSGSAQRAGNCITPAIVHGIIEGAHGYRAGSGNR